MVKLHEGGVYLVHGSEIVPASESARVEQLTGSNIIEDYDGFLIGVGINYIILQDYSSSNIRVLDIYGIKNMYVYYADLTNPYSVTRENQ